jgi:hypothetical protein
MMVMISTLVVVATLVSAPPVKEVTVVVTVTVCILMVVEFGNPAELCLSRSTPRSPRARLNW